jgi:cytochrome c peroxidase
MLVLGIASCLGLPGPIAAREPAAGDSPALPGPAFDLPVDLDGDGISAFPDRYRFNLWLARGGSLSSALSRAKVVGRVLDLSEFFASSEADLTPGVPFTFDPSPPAAPVEGDPCKTHRDLLRAALAGNEGNADEVDGFGDINHGRKAFNDRKLRGLGSNGRACADCHMASDSFQLSPASASARFAALLVCRAENPEADDPLFRPIDADDFRVNGENASDFSNLTVNGLVRITFPLPATMRLVDPATGQVTNETEVDVWRSVPSVHNVKLTGADPTGTPWFRGPNVRGGYQLDARQTTLEDQALGALLAHAEIQVGPDQSLLEEIAAFQETLFSSEGVRAMSEAIDQGAAVPDPDPVLTAEEEAGKTVFLRACGQCHGGPGQSNPEPPVTVRFHNIQTQCPRPVDGINPATGLPFFPGYTGTPRWQFTQCPPTLARNTRLYQVVRPNGEVVRRASSDPGRSLLTGFASLGAGPPPLVPPPLDDWQALDVPQIRNISKTAPYFHNNSAATLDEMLDHYEQLFKFIAATAPPPPAPRPPVISTDGVHVDRPFAPEERPALMAYLLKL